MSALHLNHLLNWTDLIEHCAIYEDHGIKLPVCDCGRIRVESKKVQLQVDQRKYLTDKVCRSPDCKIVGTKIFRKTEKRKVTVPKYEFGLSRWNIGQPADRFFKNLSRVIHQFAIEERKKVGPRESLPPPNPDDIIKKLKDEGKWPKEADEFSRYCICGLFSVLIELGDTKTLLSFSNDQIKQVLSCCHGGQAVGQYFDFLTWHVLPVYLFTNLIAAIELQDKPDEWGAMNPNQTWSYRRSLMYDCDGQTFLWNSRKYLEDDVYMKDWTGMRELCKNCFRFLYITNLLCMEVANDNSNREYHFGVLQWYPLDYRYS